MSSIIHIVSTTQMDFSFSGNRSAMVRSRGQYTDVLMYGVTYVRCYVGRVLRMYGVTRVWCYAGTVLRLYGVTLVRCYVGTALRMMYGVTHVRCYANRNTTRHFPWTESVSDEPGVGIYIDLMLNFAGNGWFWLTLVFIVKGCTMNVIGLWRSSQIFLENRFLVNSCVSEEILVRVWIST